MNAYPWSRRLMAFATLLALVVVLLGAWTRLRDAGLGCPDWPGCYGHFTVPQTAAQLDKAAQLFPGRQVIEAKAWPEMIHRYFAGTLLLVVVAFAVISFLRKGA